MAGSVQCRTANAWDKTGFEIRLRDPASLTHQQTLTPSIVAIKGALIPEAQDVEFGFPEEVPACLDLIEDAVRFAQLEGIALPELEALMKSSDNQLFRQFENLALTLARYVTDEANKAQAQSALYYSQVLAQINPELQKDFESYHQDLANGHDVMFGLVRDKDGSFFGESSGQFRFRMFTSPDFLVCQFSFQEADITQISVVNAIIQALKGIGRMTTFDWIDAGWSAYLFDEYDCGSLSKASIEALSAGLEYLNRDGIEELPVDPLTLGELENTHPELKQLLLQMVGTDEGVSRFLVNVEDVCGDCGYEDATVVLSNFLEFAKLKALDKQIKEQTKKVTPTTEGYADLLKDDPTYLADFLRVAYDDIRQVSAMCVHADEVFGVADESDFYIDSRVVLDLVEGQKDFLERNYEDHHQLLMQGEVEGTSACVMLNAATMEAIRGWQRSIPLLAALAVVSQRKEF